MNYSEPKYQINSAEGIQATNPDDKSSLKIYFEVIDKVDGKKSREYGRQIMKQVEVVKIITPGDSQNYIYKEVNDEVKRRFPVEYREFKALNENTITGNSLFGLEGMTKSKAEELKYIGGNSIEALALMDLEAADDLLQEWIIKAQKWVNLNASLVKYPDVTKTDNSKNKEVEQLKSEMNNMKSDLSDIKSLLSELLRGTQNNG